MLSHEGARFERWVTTRGGWEIGTWRHGRHVASRRRDKQKWNQNSEQGRLTQSRMSWRTDWIVGIVLSGRVSMVDGRGWRWRMIGGIGEGGME